MCSHSQLICSQVLKLTRVKLIEMKVKRDCRGNDDLDKYCVNFPDIIPFQWFDLGECPLMNTEKATCCFLEGWLYVLGNNGDLLRYSVYIKVSIKAF